ncbi:MAG: hypothetical protein ABJA32_09485 [Ginsengibacter sp.]
MKRIYFALIIILTSALFFNCQKELSSTNFGGSNTNNNISAPITATLQGNIYDENEQPAAGVQIRVGEKTSVTNDHGYFRIADAALDKNASLVIAEKPGYFKAYRTFGAVSGVNQVAIKLLKKTLSGSVSAAGGGDMTLTNGSKISLPAKGIVKKIDGSPYDGAINVYAHYIDPTSPDINETIPGSFMADDKNNKRVSLVSYGMLAVELESPSAEPLQIAKNNTAKLTIAIPSSSQSSAPSTISLWYIDEQTGLWKEEGTAVKNGNNYVGDVKHFSYWNADFGAEAVTISMTLKSQDGVPLGNTNIILIIDKGNGDTTTLAYAWADSSGQVTMSVPANKNLFLLATDQCGVSIDYQSIGSFSQNTDVGDIIIANSNISLTTIHGKLLDCNKVAVTNGYAVIYFNYQARYATTDKNGNFSTTFRYCPKTPLSFDIIGVDNISMQQGQAVSLSSTSRNFDAGNIAACGVSSVEFINYNLDGTDYKLSRTSGDSLAAYTYISSYLASVPIYTTPILGGKPNNFLTISFNHDPAAGIYPIQSFSVLNFHTIALTKPFDVTMTNYPQYINEFYEGSFSGKFKDSSNLTPVHSINGSFRVRKIY